MKKGATLLLFIFSITLYAGDSLESLTLERALQIAEEENLQINKKELYVLEKKLDVDIVNSMNFGTLDLVQDYVRSNHPGVVFGMKASLREVSFNDFGFDEFLTKWGAGASAADILATVPKNLNEPDSIGMFETYLEYKLPIFTGGMISGYKDAAKKIAEIADVDYQKEKQYIKSEVTKVFFDITLLNDFRTKLNIISDNIDQLLYNVEEFKKEGYAKNTDVLEVRARKLGIVRNLSQIDNNILLSYEYLSFLLNQRVKNIVNVSESNTQEVKEHEVDESFDVMMAKKGVEASEINVDIKTAGFFPQVGAMYRTGDAARKYDNTFDMHDNFTLGVEMRWNLFSGLKDLSEYEKARVQRLKAQNDYEMAKSGTRLSMEKALTDIKKLESEVEYREAELELKEAIYESYKERYDEKLVSINDLLIKHSEHLGAVLELLNTKNNLNKRVIEYNASFEAKE